VPPLVTLRLRRSFDAAHQLPFHRGKCHRLHGHHWQVEVTIIGTVQQDGLGPSAGMVLDFADVKDRLDRILPDHYSLNVPTNSVQFSDLARVDEPSVWKHALPNPTAEHLAVRLYDLLKAELADVMPGDAFLAAVRVWETPDCDATYDGASE
jgi:6-pyruvoyltetrahydropterin/6-carboxytetrahydropterin synthase